MLVTVKNLNDLDLVTSVMKDNCLRILKEK